MARLLDRAARERIAQVIADIEKRTAGELVVAVVPRSRTWAGVRALTAALWTLALTAALSLFLPRLEPLWLLLAELPLGALSWLAAGRPAVLRLLLHAEDVGEAVQRRAYQLFAEHGLHRTRDASGLLILLCALERRVVILGDAGIHAHVGTDGWQQHVQHVVDGIRAGRAAEAVVEVLRALGEVLAREFPPRPDDVNELPNEVVTEP